MSFNQTNTLPYQDTNVDLKQLTGVKEDTCKGITSLLGFYKLNFNFERDITDPILLDYFGVGNIFIKNFEKNGHASLWKYISNGGQQVEMGTGYALVTQEYLDKRGKIQGILQTEQGEAIGMTSFLDKEGIKHQTNIYFVGAAENESGKPVGITYKKEDIYDALQGI